jgi:hypothetical protein
MSCLNRLLVFALLAVSAAGCIVSGKIQPTLASPSGQTIDRLWIAPEDLASRDLFHGPGGVEMTPERFPEFEFIREDTTGYSPGWDVKSPDGVEWSVKTGPEAQTEVAVSRILWALGYHQPPTYYLGQWTMNGAVAGPQPAARFRPKIHQVIGEWDWYENDFLQSDAFHGLVVVNVMLNNWDWKTSNNKIYDVDGEHRFVVQDLGASLGKTAYPRVLTWLPMRGLGQGSRNDLEDFEEQGFIERVEGDRIEFDYRGIHGALIERITPGHVVWAAERMAAITDAQWDDIFRAAGYTQDQRQRYVAKIKSKIAEGLQLR